MAVTKDTICKLIGLCTNQNPHIIADQLTDEQIQTYALNIGAILKPDEVFTPADMAQFVEDDDAIYNVEEALAYAGAQDICDVFENAAIYAEAAKAAPADVFTGEDGTAKLDAWATANLAAVAADVDGLAALDAWAIAAGYTKS